MDTQCIIIAGYKLALTTPIPKIKIYQTIDKFSDKKCATNIIYLPGKNDDDHKIYISLNFYLFPRNGIVNINDLTNVICTTHAPIPNHFANIIHELSLQPSYYSVYSDHTDNGMEILL